MWLFRFGYELVSRVERGSGAVKDGGAGKIEWTTKKGQKRTQKSIQRQRHDEKNVEREYSGGRRNKW